MEWTWRTLIPQKYLGVTLDRTLSYKTHIHNTKMKVATRNNLLKKLANSRWGTNARTIRTTAIALCYSTAECAVPVWERSAYAHLLNPELNQACRAITGCLKPINVENLYLLAGITPPEIRRSVWARVERGTGGTDTLLQKQQSACESRQDASHGLSSAEQRGQKVATSIMEWSGPGDH